MGSDLDLVTLSVVQGELNAELIKSRLEAEDIPVMLKYDTYFNLQLGVFCPVSIIIPRKYLETAKEIIKPSDTQLITTIPVKNRWLFALARILFG